LTHIEELIEDPHRYFLYHINPINPASHFLEKVDILKIHV